MFKVNQKRELFYPVVLNVLKDDGSGETQEIIIKIKYKLLTRKEMRELVERSKENLKLFDSIDNVYTDLLDEEEAFVVSRITDWQGLADAETGNELPFSSKMLISVMEESTEFASKVVSGLYDASRDAPVKN